MHITLEADYAVRIVDVLARQDSIIDARALSEHTGVPLRFSLKILRNLVTGGIAKSYKGAKGGYILARKPEEITLRQVIEAIEGPYQFSRCMGEEYPCTMGKETCICRFYGIFHDISLSVRNKLDEVTFEQKKSEAT